MTAEHHAWFVNQYAQPPSEAGITRTFSIARELSEHGYRTTIFASPGNHMTRRRGATIRGTSQSVDDVDFAWVKAPWGSGNGPGRVVNMIWFGLVATLRGLLRRGPRPQVVIGSSPHLFSGLSALVLARRYRALFVLEIRDIHPQSLLELTTVSPRHPYIRLLARIEKVLYSRADIIVSPIQGMETHARSVTTVNGNVLWMPNALEQPPHPFVPTTRSDDTPLRLTYAGTHGVANGLTTVIEAAKICAERSIAAEFQLIGDGIEKPALMRLVDSYQLQNVVFHGAVPRDEVTGLLRRSNVCLFSLVPSGLWNHGLSPNKLVDYLSSGRPIISSLESQYDIVDTANAGWTVPPGDPVALADAIESVVGLSSAELDAIGRRGYEFVCENLVLAPTVATFAAAVADRLSSRPT